MTKRKLSGDNFVRLPYSVLGSPEFCELSGSACKLLLLICSRYRGFNNGGLRVSLSDAQTYLRCGRSTAKRKFDELEAAGIIECTERGGNRFRDGRQIGVPSAWRVPFLPEGSGDVVKFR